MFGLQCHVSPLPTCHHHGLCHLNSHFSLLFELHVLFLCELFNCFYKHGCCSGRDASDSNEGAETCGECSCCFGRSWSIVHSGGLNCDVPTRRAFSNPSLNLVSLKCTHQGSFNWNGSSAHFKLGLVSAPVAEGDQLSQVHAASALERRGGRRLQGPHH